MYKLEGGVSYDYTPTYDELYNDYKKGAIDKNALIDLAQKRKELDYKQANNQQLRDTTLDGVRAVIGGGLEGASFHPILNIPYIGTGLGGALFEWGDSINNKRSAIDTLKNMGKGFVVGETVGAIPYAGKAIGKTKVGSKFGDVANKAYQRIADTSIGAKIGQGLNKVGDLLMTDVFPNGNNEIQKSKNLYDYLKNDTFLNQNYDYNKYKIDKSVLPITRKFNSGNNIFEKTNKEVLYDSGNPLHEAQLELINKTNPAPDSYHTWIRNADDIHNFEDTLKAPIFDEDFIGNDFDPSYSWNMAQQAIKDGTIDVYSSYPIKEGVFVTPSSMEAQSYSGNGQIYSKNVPLRDVAWIEATQGQYAPIPTTENAPIPTTENAPIPTTENAPIENSVKNVPLKPFKESALYQKIKNKSPRQWSIFNQ